MIFFGAVGFTHSVLLCCMFLKSEKVKVINQGIWLIKLLILRLSVNTTFFKYLQYFSIWDANFLYVLESIVFVDLVYVVDKAFDECAKQNNKIYILKAIISISVYITASFICFVSFQHNQTYVSVINAVFLAIFLVLAFIRTFEGNSILVAGMIGLNMNILGFYVQDDAAHNIGQDYNGFLIAFKYVFFLVFLIGMLGQGSSRLRTKKSTINELLALNTNKSEEDNRYVSSNKWTVYHYILTMICMGVPAGIYWQSQNHVEINNWMEINSMVWWLSGLFFYIWSLVSMKVFPDKDFSDLENYFREYQLQ